MAAKSVNQFFEKVAEDKSLQTKLNALQKKAVMESKEKASTEIVKIAAAAGFKFSAKDLAQANKAKAAKPRPGQLGDTTGQESCWYGQNYFCVNYICGSYTYN